MGDWLGTGFVATFEREYLSFEDARKYVHGLKLKDRAEWWQYCKSGKRPTNIPSSVQNVYKDKGWAGWPDWLGTE